MKLARIIITFNTIINVFLENYGPNLNSKLFDISHLVFDTD